MFFCKYKKNCRFNPATKKWTVFFASSEGKLLFHINIYSNPKRYEHFLWTQLQPNIQI